MRVQHVTDLKTPIGKILRSVGQDGLLLASRQKKRYALMPLDDELIDFLLLRNPKFAEDCRRIRQQMKAGHYHSHEEVKKLLASD